MPPQTITFALGLLQLLIEHEPEIAAEVKALFTKADPTDEDWQALHDKVAAKSYRDYVPATALPVVPAVAPVPALPAIPIRVLPAPEVPATNAGAGAGSDQAAVTAPGPVTPAPAPAHVTLNAAQPTVRSLSMSPIVPAPATPTAPEAPAK